MDTEPNMRRSKKQLNNAGRRLMLALGLIGVDAAFLASGYLGLVVHRISIPGLGLDQAGQQASRTGAVFAFAGCALAVVIIVVLRPAYKTLREENPEKLGDRLKRQFKRKKNP